MGSNQEIIQKAFKNIMKLHAVVPISSTSMERECIRLARQDGFEIGAKAVIGFIEDNSIEAVLPHNRVHTCIMSSKWDKFKKSAGKGKVQKKKDRQSGVIPSGDVSLLGVTPAEPAPRHNFRCKECGNMVKVIKEEPMIWGKQLTYQHECM